MSLIGDPPPMLVDTLLPETSLVILSGKPKAGKSLVALNIAYAVCTGTPVFGRFQVNRPGPVCYISMEDGEYELARRMRMNGLTPADNRQLFVITERRALFSEEQVAQLERALENIRPVLVIIDTAREALGVKDWNDAGEVSARIRPIREFARRFCSIILVAHNRKADGAAGDEIAGSNAFTSSVDGWLSANSVSKTDDGFVRAQFTVDGRGGMRGKFVTELDPSTLLCRAIDAGNTPTTRADEEFVRVRPLLPCLQALQDLGGSGTTAQIASRIPAASGQSEEAQRKQVSRCIAEAARFELIERADATASDQGRGRRAAVYALTKKGTGMVEFGRSGPLPGDLSSMSAAGEQP